LEGKTKDKSKAKAPEKQEKPEKVKERLLGKMHSA
jgi:hypothetical protein